MYSDCDLSGPSIPRPGNVSHGPGLLKAVQSRERVRAGGKPVHHQVRQCCTILIKLLAAELEEIWGQAEGLGMVVLHWSEWMKLCGPDSSIPTAAFVLRGAHGFLRYL